MLLKRPPVLRIYYQGHLVHCIHMVNDQGHILGRLVAIFPSRNLHNFSCACQRVYPSQTKVLTKSIILYFMMRL